ncbi:cobyrinic acid a c-diamide synthase cbia [Lucifera butyrica]|uniref:Cobyrinate a,c-diamide synthase n=1 Tax=Lucifera butyrica TaxID=1351585 RepID=A0A498R9L7_9FIRM|nr:cobyrinate a,c-diamide synthase [Lucifera butyrica]VBB06833.1 cobyrinic acid a c-diamide synthase cbia [Lucifera butyrica]
MVYQEVPRLVIAGTHSGVGKTTVVTGLLAALRQLGREVQSYKVGPDYIDPGFHRLASGKAAHNLDTWLVAPENLLPVFAKTAKGNDLVIIEGVMGLYDGGKKGISSTASIAKILQAPVILVVDARSAGESVAATVLGFKTYDPAVNIAGIIVNRLGSSSHKDLVCDALRPIGIPVIGCILRDQAMVMPERHLGLTPVTEMDAPVIVSHIADQINSQVDLDRLTGIAGTAPALAVEEWGGALPAKIVRIGVARDEVFSFYYPESLETLERLGAELVYFSPLREEKLPAVDGLILGGGFPEMFVEQLAANAGMRQSVHRACESGMPVYAECGGLMYLCREILDFNHKAHAMAGFIPAVCTMQPKLETVGYVEVTARNHNILCNQGETLRGHEFHFSRMLPQSGEDDFPWAFTFEKVRTRKTYPGGFAVNNVLASYLHMHFAGNERAAAHFITQCKRYGQSRQRPDWHIAEKKGADPIGR